MPLPPAIKASQFPESLYTLPPQHLTGVWFLSDYKLHLTQSDHCENFRIFNQALLIHRLHSHPGGIGENMTVFYFMIK